MKAKTNHFSNIRNVGQYFHKNQIFCGTLERKRETKSYLKERFKENKELGSKISAWCKLLADKEIEEYQEYDIFYKDEKGYTRFVDEGPETFIGDDSDGKGIIKNIVPIWKYYNEGEVKEVLVNGKYVAIGVVSVRKLQKYKFDYNQI